MSAEGTTAIAAVASTILAAVLAAWLGNVTGKKTAYRDQALKFDQELRGDRVRCYPGLLAELKVLAFARLLDLSSVEVSALLVGITDWYYKEGALYLSRRSQVAYVALMEAARDIVNRQEPAGSTSSAQLRHLGSKLRGSLTQDLGGRADSPVTQHE
jgi:hypothetical protein